MSEGTLLAIEGLVCRYGALTAVDGLTLAVERGEMFGLIGPDGAGKTTTLRTALGLLAPAAGTVRTCGLDPRAARRELAGRVGYLSQRFSLYGDLSVDENVAFFAEIHRVRDWRPRRDALLDRVGLGRFRDRLAGRLSGGMKQKLALACTLVHTPELLVLDEPTAGVDPVSRREFWRLLAGLQREGLTIVLTTPYLDEAERCNRVALLDHGHLLALDTPEGLRGRGVGVLVEVLAKPRRAAAEVLAAFDGVEDVAVFGERLHVRVAGDPAAGQQAADRLAAALAGGGVEVESARPVSPSLEDVFIAEIRDRAPEVGR